MEHTPIPWEVKTQAPGGPQIWAKRIQVAFAFAGDSQPSEANAEFIVRAVNNYAKLLEALEACEAVLRKDGERTLVVRNAGLPGPPPEKGFPRNLVLANNARDAIEEARK